MVVKKISGNYTMCAGYNYEYEVTFSHYPITVQEALQEISEWREAHTDTDYSAHKTCVDDAIVESTWIQQPWDRYYDNSTLDKQVIRCLAEGGWYCGIDIRLYTK